MANVVTKNEISVLFNEMMLQMDVLEETMSNSLKIEREEMEEVMKGQIQRLHITLDEVEKVMKDQRAVRSEPANSMTYTQSAYSM